MGLQIPYCICAQIPQKEAVRKVSELGWRNNTGLCRQRGVELLEGHLMPDHIHMYLSIPPKNNIAFVIDFLKSKSAVLIHRTVLDKPN
jgi:hypothetical protein